MESEDDTGMKSDEDTDKGSEDDTSKKSDRDIGKKSEGDASKGSEDDTGKKSDPDTMITIVKLNLKREKVPLREFFKQIMSDKPKCLVKGENEGDSKMVH